MIRGLRSILFTAAASLTLCASVGATTITTTSYNLWKTQLTGAPTEADFTSIRYTSYNSAAGMSLSAIGDPSTVFTVTGPDGSGYQMSGMNYGGYASLAGSADSGALLNIAAPASGENAFLIAAETTGSSTISLSLSDGQSFTITSGLFAFTLSHPISSFTLGTAAGSQVILSDLWYGNSALAQDPVQGGGSTNSPGVDPTPEGATFVLLGGGLLVLFGARRKFASMAI